MPSAYLLVYYINLGARHVLFGHKNIIGVRLGGNPHAQMIWNNAGQLAIPGGRLLDGELPAVGAKREFFEETGIDFRLQGTRDGYGYVNEALYVDPASLFCVNYIQIGFDNATALSGDITNNIAQGVPADDELYDVRWFPQVGAAGQLAVSPNPSVPGTWQALQHAEVLPLNLARRNAQMAAAFDWFQTGANNCP